MNDEANESLEPALAKSDEVPARDSAEEPVAGVPSQGIPQEVLDKLPAGSRQVMEFAMMQMGPLPNPLHQRITAAHIDKALDNAEKADSRQAEAFKQEVNDRKHNRVTTWVGVFAVVALLGGLYGFIPNDRLAAYQEVIEIVIAVASGALGGYGVAIAKSKEKG